MFIANRKDNSLVTIGTHGMDNTILTKVTTEEKRRQIKQAKEDTELLIGKKIDLFAYTAGEYDKECIHLIRESGYQYAMTTVPLPINQITKLRTKLIPRYNITNTTRKTMNACIDRIVKRV